MLVVKSNHIIIIIFQGRLTLVRKKMNKKRLLAIILDATTSIYANNEYKISRRNIRNHHSKILFAQQNFTNPLYSLLYVVLLYIIW